MKQYEAASSQGINSNQKRVRPIEILKKQLKGLKRGLCSKSIPFGAKFHDKLRLQR